MNTTYARALYSPLPLVIPPRIPSRLCFVSVVSISSGHRCVYFIGKPFRGRYACPSSCTLWVGDHGPKTTDKRERITFSRFCEILLTFSNTCTRVRSVVAKVLCVCIFAATQSIEIVVFLVK